MRMSYIRRSPKIFLGTLPPPPISQRAGEYVGLLVLQYTYPYTLNTTLKAPLCTVSVTYSCPVAFFLFFSSLPESTVAWLYSAAVCLEKGCVEVS